MKSFEKKVPLAEFEPTTFRSVVRRYPNCATKPTVSKPTEGHFINLSFLLYLVRAYLLLQICNIKGFQLYVKLAFNKIFHVTKFINICKNCKVLLPQKLQPYTLVIRLTFSKLIPSNNYIFLRYCDRWNSYSNNASKAWWDVPSYTLHRVTRMRVQIWT